MIQIATFFWQLCLLRKSPEQLPASPFATGIVLLVYLVIALVAVSITRPDRSLVTVAGIVLTGAMLQAFVTFALLAFKGFRHRFQATWSAILGANAIMLLVLLPFNYIILHAQSGPLLVFADSVTWVCLIWWLAIAGFIYHKAVEISMIQGFVLAFLIELLGAIIAFNLFPR